MVTYIDCDELAVRIGEACMNVERPKGMSAGRAFVEMQKLNLDASAGFMRAANRAALYIAECCNADNPGSVEVKEILRDRAGGVPS